MQIDMRLKGEKYPKGCHHQNYIQKEPGKYLGE
jgi:hypothetical protein